MLPSCSVEILKKSFNKWAISCGQKELARYVFKMRAFRMDIFYITSAPASTALALIVITRGLTCSEWVNGFATQGMITFV